MPSHRRRFARRGGFYLRLLLGLGLPTLVLVWVISFAAQRQAEAIPARAAELVRGQRFADMKRSSAASQPGAPPLRAAAAKSPPGSVVTAGSSGGSPGYQSVSFDRLADYVYLQSLDVPGEEPASKEMIEQVNRIPDSIKELDAKPISVTGFMMPLDISPEGVTGFLLVKDQTLCCWGMKIAMMNEWIRVQMKPGKTASYVKHAPTTVRGVISVGEEKTEDGFVLSIYRMEGDEVLLEAGF